MAKLNKLYFRVAVFALLTWLAAGSCNDLDLGMESGLITDSQITSSSVRGNQVPPENGRLNYTAGKSWCAKGSDSSPHLQIDLETLHIICAVSTQGNYEENEWVKTYKLQSSTDGTTWTDYQEDKQVKIFIGNVDRNSEVKHLLYEGLLTRYLRFLPMARHNIDACMRTELFGVKKQPENLALRKVVGQSSTSGGNVPKRAVDGNPNTEMNNGHCSHTNDNNPSWWRVDLGTARVPVSEVHIVNRFSSIGHVADRSKDYKITLGASDTVTSNPQCEGLYSFVNFTASAVCFNNPLMTGRYLGIMTTRKQFLQLCEVEVYSRENLAFNKLASQSSVWNSKGPDGAVDGNTGTNIDSPCTHTVGNGGSGTSNPWWRVDLGQVEPVSEVYVVNRDSLGARLDGFEIRVGTSDSNGGVSNPKCGDTYSVPQREGLSFYCRPSLLGRYVTIRIPGIGKILTLCEVEVYSERRACQIQAVGLASSIAVPDDRFSAKSSRSGNGPSKGRLTGGSAWAPSSNSDATDYLQINLGYYFYICAVATQGNPSADQWTKKYKLQLSLDSSNWVFYQENNADKVFNGNSGRNDVVKHNLKKLTRARFLRFEPTAYSGHKAMRVEVYGIEKPRAPSQAPSDFAVNPLSSTSVRASWQLPPLNSRHGIIIGFKLLYKEKGSGSSQSQIVISVNTTLTKDVTGLDKYTEYEFQVLAFSSAGDGKRSSVETERTNQDVPSQAPASFSVSASSSTSVRAAWQLPPLNSRHGIITGFKLFYKQTGSGAAQTEVTINSDSIFERVVTGLEKYTEYKFQILAYTSAGDGQRSSLETVGTNEDVPSQAPANFTVSASSSTSVRAAWQLPPSNSRHGIIIGFKLFYKLTDSGAAQTEVTIKSGSTHNRVVTGLEKYTEYEFQILAYTSVGDGPNSTETTLRTNEDAPSVGPRNVSFAEVNETTWNISWAPMARAESHGIIIMYQVKRILKSRGERSRRSTANTAVINSTQTHAVLYGLQLCAQYNVSVRGFTGVGPGPYSTPPPLITSKPGTPRELTAEIIKDDYVTLRWEEPIFNTKDGLKYTVDFSGTKDYNSSFKHDGSVDADKLTMYNVTGLVPGSKYKFNLYGTSVCGKGSKITTDVTTTMAAPLSPVVRTPIPKTIDQTKAEVELWPAEQRNGPISAYQVIVHEVSDEDEDLPSDYRSKIGDYKKASEINLKYYITAEFENDRVRTEPWEFTVGDGEESKGYKNAELKRGNIYIVYQRAITNDNVANLAGEVSKVGTITVNHEVAGDEEESKFPTGVAVGIPLVLLLIIAIVVIAVIFIRRRRRSVKRDNNNRAQVPLDNLGQDPLDARPSRENVVYQNVDDIRIEERPPPSPEVVVVKREPENDSHQAIAVGDFANYYKKTSVNGGTELRKEFKAIPGGLQFPWGIGQKNKPKNRYGNIVTYDHSRVVLEKTGDDPTSDYINASYIPTYDGESTGYIATQGPTSLTTNDFWRMIWQENCSVIVMLTNLIEMGKAKCEKYWPDNTTKYGAISVSLHKSEGFSDYEIRTFIMIKDEQKRRVVQFHFTSWPDKGVPQHATPLLGFRRKVRAYSSSTDSPLVVHCSAGVGRTGTYIAMDTMLESAEKKKSVFIHKFMQEMRGARPYMVQTDDQYVFLHQAVMEALTCGNTEIAVQDLRIAMNRLAVVDKSKQKTGYQKEFKRLEQISTLLGSNEQTTTAYDPNNISKNRFPNIVPLDTARVILMTSGAGKDYINASFVDEYKKRNAYILTQAPLGNTIEDFWQMVSQYNVGTVVMLNGLKERKESFPQYWPSEGSEKYGSTSVQLLSENKVNTITTRKFSVLSEEPRRKKSTVQHLQYTGWTNNASCPDPQDILDLLTAVQQSQQQTGDGVIVFQCSNGVGRSGTVAAIISIVERSKAEQNIDVFQAVKLIRVKRPGAVETLVQYMFCYQTIQAYLDSFNEYANFRG